MHPGFHLGLRINIAVRIDGILAAREYVQGGCVYNRSSFAYVKC
jgi:hypothetical protein